MTCSFKEMLIANEFRARSFATQAQAQKIQPTCDALDVVLMAENLPSDLQPGGLPCTEQIGAYNHDSSACFNGLPPATVVHVNQ